MPSQYYAGVVGGGAPSGEFKLFYAILEDALRSYVRAKDSRSALRRAEFLDAQAWFNSRGTHLFSFESVCGFLGIDPSWLRARLNSLTPTDFPLKQYRTRRNRVTRASAHRDRACGAKAAVDSANGAVSSASGLQLIAPDSPSESPTFSEIWVANSTSESQPSEDPTE